MLVVYIECKANIFIFNLCCMFCNFKLDFYDKLFCCLENMSKIYGSFFPDGF